jgi:superfamily I DNA/RNA helicase
MITADEWRPAAGMSLEPNAERAVREIVRSVALTAGPGAGKTEMLAQRADFLFRTGECPYPRRILAISFKVDASRNLKDRVAQRCGYALASRLDSHTFHAFAKRMIDRYRPVLTGIDALDADYSMGPNRVQRTTITFADLVPLALTIIEDSQTARSAIRQTYSHVFLDEFQDCTTAQYELVRAAFRGSAALITAVGDTKQRIMGWAGALEGIFQQLASDFDAQPLNLYQNFRAQPALRRMQNRMIEVMEPGAAVSAKDLEGQGGTIEALPFANAEDEAEHIAQLIVDVLGAGSPPSEIAVLVAKQVDELAAPLMSRLTELGVSYRNERTAQDLAADPIAELILNLFRVIIDRRQPEAYQRLMTLAERFGADDETSDRTRSRASRYIRQARAGFADGSTDYQDPDAVRQVADGYLAIMGRDTLATLSPDYHNGERLTEQIDASVAQFTAQVSMGNEPSQALRQLSETTAVRLMTVHKSKGLEFDTVILLSVETETFWGKLDEERSVFFVGISRARSRLVLTTADTRSRPQDFRGRWAVGRHPQAEFLSYVE